MALTRKVGPRRAEIRKGKHRRSTEATLLGQLQTRENQASLVILIVFAVLASVILCFRPAVSPYRPGQYLPHDVVSRVNFTYRDPQAMDRARDAARSAEPRVYRSTGDVLGKLQEQLHSLPDRVSNQRLDQLAEPLRENLDNASLARLQEYAARDARPAWTQAVKSYIAAVRDLNLVILPESQRLEDGNQVIRIPGMDAVRVETTFDPTMTDELIAKLTRPASDNFSSIIFPKIVRLTLASLPPTHTLDEAATVLAQNRAAADVNPAAGDVPINANQTIVRKGEVNAANWLVLKEEHAAYMRQMGPNVWIERLGLVAMVGLLSTILAIYIARFQPRVVRNHARAFGIAALMLSMLVLVQLSRLGPNNIYFFGIGPTIFVAMILAIAYDQRFAFGVAAMHAVLAVLALNESLNFLLVLLAGIATCCFMLDEVRTRSRLIEVGGGTALAMMGAMVGIGLISLDPMAYALRNALYAGAAGLAVGFITLGILPFIERAFRITTSMTLLELADASHPLLRRLALEAPGTYNHSIQVATLAEEAAEAIEANSLLCRVSAYYHDVGKINKADYFVENQSSGMNRHMSLSPSVSLLIIIGHVKDGMELAKEYNLPTAIMSFIHQHHGTTLVEFFYHRAKTLQTGRAEGETVQQDQYRYPGPKPTTRETAILMLADACESATRAMTEPNANRIEALVHDLSMKRLLDGQFDNCDLTMRELELIERSLMKTLLGIYHGRIAYPSDKPSARLSDTGAARLSDTGAATQSAGLPGAIVPVGGVATGPASRADAGPEAKLA